MTSLGDVYGGGADGSLRRLYLGVGLFVVGAVLVTIAIAITTTGVLTSRGFSMGGARELGGILGGVGVSATLLGVTTVLPASRRTRAGSVVGASVSLLGVALFAHAYPCRWVGSTCGLSTDLTLVTVGVYFLGAITAFWCLFVGVATFKTRNDPGGTARLFVERGERTVVRPESGSRSRDVRDALGGVGFLGSTPDGDVETQTAAASDGGSTDDGVRTPEGTGPGSGSATGRRGGANAGTSTGTGTSTSTGTSAGADTGTSSPADGSGGRRAATRSGPPADDGAEVFRGTSRDRSDDAGRASRDDGRGSAGRTSGGRQGDRSSNADAPPWQSTGGDEPETRAERERRRRPAPGVKPDWDGDDGRDDERGDWPTSTDGGTRAAPVRTPVTGESTSTPRPTSAPDPAPAPAPTAPAAPEARGAGDAYCGSCAAFRYVRTDEGLRPYCAAHDRTMDDMTACDDWTGRF